jgi:hypothetical protein
MRPQTRVRCSRAVRGRCGWHDAGCKAGAQAAGEGWRLCGAVADASAVFPLFTLAHLPPPALGSPTPATATGQRQGRGKRAEGRVRNGSFESRRHPEGRRPEGSRRAGGRKPSRSARSIVRVPLPMTGWKKDTCQQPLESPCLCLVGSWGTGGRCVGGRGKTIRPSGAERQLLRSARAPGGRTGGWRRWPRASVVGERGEQRGSARQSVPARSRLRTQKTGCQRGRG